MIGLGAISFEKRFRTHPGLAPPKVERSGENLRRWGKI
jgi:hypothetical protein